MAEENFSPEQSLKVINEMISKAKGAYWDTGVSAMMWGIVIAVCSLVKLSELQFNYELPFDIYWLAMIAIIPQVIISTRENKKRTVRTYEEFYLDYIWMTFGITIMLLIVITNVIFNADGVKNGGFNFFEYIASLFLLLYGIPTFITGAACKFRSMLWGGLLCWACCIISLFTNIKIDLILTAVSAVCAWLIPGIIMQREYKKAKKELAQSDVQRS
jgi:hypothetical protein